MAQVKFHKFVAELPAALEPNAIYYVRVGAGFDIYVTNGSGMVVAYPLNVAASGQGFFRTEVVTATAAGQTAFTVPGGYTPGAVIVSLNGSTLTPADYTAMDGSTVVLASGAGMVSGSVLLLYVLTPFEVADALPLGGTAYDSARYAGLLPPPSDGKQYAIKDGEWAEVVGGSGGDSRPVLSVDYVISRLNIGDGEAALDGQLLPRNTYFDAYAQAQAIGMVISEAEWQADPLKRGFFSSGDGSTTFRLPDYNGKQPESLGAVFLRGDGALSAGGAGVIQQDAFQGHRHETNFNTAPATASLNATNFLASATASPVGYARPTSDAVNTVIGGDPIADATSGAPRVAPETRPLNVTGVWVIKLFGAVVNVGSVDAAQLASDYANLAAELQSFESRYDSEVEFTIIYPNGGSEASPATVAQNTRYVEANPFPGYRVICEAQILYSGEWGNPGQMLSGSAASTYGVTARQLNEGSIVVRTGQTGLMYNQNLMNGSFNYSASTAVSNLPCRVLVWKVKGVIA